MSDWREGFEDAVVMFVAEYGWAANLVSWGMNGEPVPDVHRPRIEAWREAHDHLQVCGPDLVKSGKVRGLEWTEFEDTEAENSEHHAVGAMIVCTCGLVQETFVVEVTFSELLLGILMGEKS